MFLFPKIPDYREKSLVQIPTEKIPCKHQEKFRLKPQHWSLSGTKILQSQLSNRVSSGYKTTLKVALTYPLLCNLTLLHPTIYNPTLSYPVLTHPMQPCPGQELKLKTSQYHFATYLAMRNCS